MISAERARELAEEARKLGMPDIAEIWEEIAGEEEEAAAIVDELLDV